MILAALSLASCPIIGARYSGPAGGAEFTRLSPVAGMIGDVALAVRPTPSSPAEHMVFDGGSSGIVFAYPVSDDPATPGWYVPGDVTPGPNPHGSLGKSLTFHVRPGEQEHILLSEQAAPAAFELRDDDGSRRSRRFVRAACGPASDRPVGPASRLNDPETEAVLSLDLASFPNSTGPRRAQGRHTLADYGFTVVRREGDKAVATLADGSWRIGLRVLSDGIERPWLLCVTDRALNGGSYATQTLIEARRGADRLLHATGRVVDDRRCPTRR